MSKTAEQQLQDAGFNAKAAAFLAAEIAAGKAKLDKVLFTAQMDLRYVPKVNAQHEGE
jgi:hypothetical protein